MSKFSRYIPRKEILDQLSSVLTALFLVGIAFISFKIGSLTSQESFTPGESKLKEILPQDQGGSVSGAKVDQPVEEKITSESKYINYIYLPDYSVLLENLRKEKSYLETNRGVSWYEDEKAKIEEEHNNNSQFLFNQYIDIINHYEFLISQCGDCPQGEEYEQKIQRATKEFEEKQRSEDLFYQQNLADLESEWNQIQARIQTLQNLIEHLSLGKEVDSAFWAAYYQFP